MATTALGRELTQAHRVEQVTLAESAALDAQAALSDFSAVRTERTWNAWRATTVLAAASRWRQSQQIATAYLSEFDRAERAPVTGRVVTLTFPGLRTDHKVTDLLSLREWIDLDSLAGIEGQLKGLIAQTALAGGRSTLDRTTRARRLRYRRVTDGKPCAFCAMLASSGPRYSEETAYFRAHPHCGCTAEPVYGAWQPTELERDWADAYAEAAEQARAAGEPVVAPSGRRRRDTVLWRMRRNEPGLFSDGIRPKATQIS